MKSIAQYFRPVLIAGSFLLVTLMLIPQASAQVAQTPLDPTIIPKYVDPVPTFVGVRVPGTSSLSVDMREIQQKVLPNSIYAPLLAPFNAGSYVWAYKVGNAPAFYPGYTIEAVRNTPLNVTYVNSLGTQTLRPVLQQYLKVDQTLHWAAPLGHPTNHMVQYTGPVPAVVHLHGAEVPSESDGGPDSWFTPGYQYTGPSWNIGGTDQFYMYPNTQEATTMFFHDHTLGATRLNLYAGLAGIYFLRDSRDNGATNNPIGLPAGKYEVELAIQDRMFDTNGQLLFPSAGINPTIHPFWLPEFFGDVIVVNGKSWPYLDVEPRRYRFRLVNGSNARFYNMRIVEPLTGNAGPPIWQIGTDGGFLDAPVEIPVAKRLLLGPGERADIIVDFAGYEGKTLLIDNDAKAPFPNGAPAYPQTVGQIMQFRVGRTITGGRDNSKQIRQLSLRTSPIVKLANFKNASVGSGVTVSKYRKLTLNEVMGAGGPTEVLVNNTKWDGTFSPNASVFSQDGITEKPVEGTTEVWQIINLTADAHPIHLHLVQFQLVSRQLFNTNTYNRAYNEAFPGGVSPIDGLTYPPGTFIPGYGPPKPYGFYEASGWLGGNPDVMQYLQGKRNSAEDNEKGWKDTFIMYPGEVTTVIARWAPTDLPLTTPKAQLVFPFDPGEGPGYVWHCHIVDHEDNEMMRPYKVIRSAGAVPGQHAEAGPAQLEPTLEQNYPNPFNPTTEIRFRISEDTRVTLALYNSLGQEVATLLDAEALAGPHAVRFDAEKLASGVYYYRIQAGSFTAMKKMVLVR